MKILMVLEGDFFQDNRVVKEVKSLTEAGHTVDIVCADLHQKKTFEDHQNYRVFRLSISKLMYKMSAAALVLPFYFAFWKKSIRKICKSNTYHVIHVHDLPLAKVGYYFKRKLGIKLVCDQHEYYSNWIVHTAHYNKGIGKIVNALSKWKTYERKYLSYADLVITIEEPLKETYINEVGLKAKKVITVPNTPEKDLFYPENSDAKIQQTYKDQFVLFYAGGIDRLRGLEIPLKAIALIKDRIPNIKLIIAGKQAKDFDIEQIAHKLGILNFVDYLKWIPHNKLPHYLNIAKIGFFTPPGNRDEIHKTIATKIYQYLLMGVPLIVSNVTLMRNFVINNNIGYVVENENQFAEACIEIQQNIKKQDDFRKNCLQVSQHYEWNHTIQDLIKFYENISK